MAILRVVEGRTACVEYNLGKSTSIGRGEDNEVRILDETSSRKHAEIRMEGGGFLLEDNKSSNGTFLNDQRVEKAVLADGDEIAIGAARFVFHASGMGSKETVIVGSDDSVKVKSTIEASGYSAARDTSDALSREVLRKALEIQGIASESVDPEDLMEKLCQALLDLMDCDRAAVLAASKSGRIEPLAVKSRGRSGKTAFILSSSVVGDVVSAGKAILISDSACDPRSQRSDSMISQNVSTALCVPVDEGGKVVALIYLDRTGEAPPFTDGDLRSAVALAEQAAHAIRSARKYAKLSQHASNLEKVLRGNLEIVGTTAAFLSAVDTARRVAETDSTVLITGETGTGKELFARLVHAESRRRGRPFVPVNCASLVGTLLESELFGHEKGAFTGADRRKPGMFELADCGTLFLDEIGEMSPEVQAKLLRAIQDKAFFRVGGTVPVEVDIRIVAATNRDLRASIDDGRFRADLFYRLSVVTIDVPPLRDRPADIIPLAEHFLRKCSAKTGRQVDGFDAAAAAMLEHYRWPGNVRELENIIERAVVLSRGGIIGPDLVPLQAGPAPAAGQGAPAVTTLKEAERRAIAAALNHTGWKKGEAAKILDISWPTLNKKIQDYGISREGGPPGE